MEENELKLLKQAKKGNEQAISRLFNALNKTAFSISYRILKRADQAEDIVLDCFAKILENRFSIETNLSAYFYRSVANTSINLLKKEKKESISYNDYNYDQPDYETPESETEKKMITERIMKAIDELPENQRMAFNLVKYEELSYKEAAEIMNTSVKSIEGLVARARKTLQEKLKDLF